MNRKELTVVSICIICLFIFWSSTNALGQQIVKIPAGETKKMYQSDDLLSNKIKPVLKNADRLRHPFLFLIVWLYIQFYLYRGWNLYELSISVGAFNWIQIEYPLLFLRAISLILVGTFWLKFWQQLSSVFGWNWFLETYPWYKTSQ